MAEPRCRWVIVAAGALLGCVAAGAMFSLPVFLAPMTEATGWSRTGVSSAMTIAFLAMAAGSLFWGAITDRFGPRPVVLIGSVLLAASLALAGDRPWRLRPFGRGQTDETQPQRQRMETAPRHERISPRPRR